MIYLPVLLRFLHLCRFIRFHLTLSACRGNVTLSRWWWKKCFSDVSICSVWQPWSSLNKTTYCTIVLLHLVSLCLLLMQSFTTNSYFSFNTYNYMSQCHFMWVGWQEHILTFLFSQTVLVMLSSTFSILQMVMKHNSQENITENWVYIK